MKENVIQMKTPITYYGGKQKMLKYIVPMIPEHSIYNEPFFGGGAVFFAKRPARVECINDHDGEVINFYAVCKNKYCKLKQMIDSTLHSEYQQKQARSIYAHPREYDEVRRAWAVWVLSHQSFYSILTNTWKCSKSRSLGDQIQTRKDAFSEEYCRRLEHTSIFCRDALDVIRKADHEDAFHYIDPPYFNADMGHYGGYTEADFTALLEILTTIKGKFMLSSYPSDVLYKYARARGWQTYEINLPRSAGGGSKVKVLTLNYEPPALPEELRQAA